MHTIKNIAVLTSGGDSPGMNAAIRAITRTAIKNNLTVYGIKRGYQGMVEGDIIHLDSDAVSGIIQKGGTILKSARSKDFKTPEGRKTAYDQLIKHDIGGLIVIGGDGSFNGANLFSKEFNFPVVGVPGTIDNDIYGTEYTIGYDTALNTVLDAVDKLKDTASAFDRIFFVEVMGKEAGFIALTSGIASGAEGVLIPEVPGQFGKLLEIMKQRDNRHKSSIILVAEGEKEGSTLELAERFQKEFPETSVRVTILGHIQRGGSPTVTDRVAASRMGAAAVEALLDDQKNIMIGLQNNQIVQIPLNKTTKMHKKVSEELVELLNLLI